MDIKAEDTDRLIALHKGLVEEWMHQDIGECVVNWAYYGSIDRMPQDIQESLKLLEGMGHKFDWETKLFVK